MGRSSLGALLSRTSERRRAVVRFLLNEGRGHVSGHSGPAHHRRRGGRCGRRSVVPHHLPEPSGPGALRAQRGARHRRAPRHPAARSARRAERSRGGSAERAAVHQARSGAASAGRAGVRQLFHLAPLGARALGRVRALGPLHPHRPRHPASGDAGHHARTRARPGARDQEPLGRHSRRGATAGAAAAGGGAAVHHGHHFRGRPPAQSGRPGPRAERPLPFRAGERPPRHRTGGQAGGSRAPVAHRLQARLRSKPAGGGGATSRSSCRRR